MLIYVFSWEFGGGVGGGGQLRLTFPDVTEVMDCRTRPRLWDECAHDQLFWTHL